MMQFFSYQMVDQNTLRACEVKQSSWSLRGVYLDSNTKVDRNVYFSKRGFYLKIFLQAISISELSLYLYFSIWEKRASDYWLSTTVILTYSSCLPIIAYEIDFFWGGGVMPIIHL